MARSLARYDFGIMGTEKKTVSLSFGPNEVARDRSLAYKGA